MHGSHINNEDIFRTQQASYLEGPLLSIIIPVYNVEKYLPECLDSLMHQTLPQKYCEILVIDDKSADRSLEIAQTYAKSNSNIKITALPENTPGGAGIPSNIGMRAAKGKYIGFLDSDDYARPQMFESMLEKALINDSDLVLCAFELYNELDGNTWPSYDQTLWQMYLSPGCGQMPEQDFKSILLALSPVPWRKIYKRSFIEEKGIYYPEGDFFYEDNPLHWFAVLEAKTINCVDEILLTQRMGRAGQTMEARPEKLIAFTAHAATIKKFLLECGHMGKYESAFVNWLLSQLRWILSKMPVSEQKVLRREFFSRMSPILSDLKYEALFKHKKIYGQSFVRFIRNFFLLHPETHFTGRMKKYPCPHPHEFTVDS